MWTPGVPAGKQPGSPVACSGAPSVVLPGPGSQERSPQMGTSSKSDAAATFGTTALQHPAPPRSSHPGQKPVDALTPPPFRLISPFDHATPVGKWGKSPAFLYHTAHPGFNEQCGTGNGAGELWTSCGQHRVLSTIRPGPPHQPVPTHPLPGSVDPPIPFLYPQLPRSVHSLAHTCGQVPRRPRDQWVSSPSTPQEGRIPPPKPALPGTEISTFPVIFRLPHGWHEKTRTQTRTPAGTVGIPTIPENMRHVG